MAEADFRLRTTDPHLKHLPVFLVGLCLRHNPRQDQGRLSSQETEMSALREASVVLSSSACNLSNDPCRKCIITIVPSVQTGKEKRLRLSHIQREVQEQANLLGCPWRCSDPGPRLLDLGSSHFPSTTFLWIYTSWGMNNWAKYPHWSNSDVFILGLTNRYLIGPLSRKESMFGTVKLANYQWLVRSWTL